MISNVRSSLIYQLTASFQSRLSVVYFVTIFIIYFYKGSILPYQNYVRVMELLIILSFIPIEYLRVTWGTRGNLLESSALLLLSAALSVPILLIVVYMAFFQNFVLFIEELLSYVQGGFVIFETILSFALSITLSGTGTPAAS